MSSEAGRHIREAVDARELEEAEVPLRFRARVERLEKENEELREEVEHLKEGEEKAVTKTVVNQLLAAIVGGETIDFAANPFENKGAMEDFGDRVNNLENTIARLETLEDRIGKGKSNGPTEAWLNIVEWAKRNKNNEDHQLPNNRVQLFRENIAKATGVGEKQAGNYIEWFGDDDGKYAKPGTSWQPYQKPNAFKNRNKPRKKRLVVELDVWGDDDE